MVLRLIKIGHRRRAHTGGGLCSLPACVKWEECEAPHPGPGNPFCHETGGADASQGLCSRLNVCFDGMGVKVLVPPCPLAIPSASGRGLGPEHLAMAQSMGKLGQGGSWTGGRPALCCPQGEGGPSSGATLHARLLLAWGRSWRHSLKVVSKVAET